MQHYGVKMNAKLTSEMFELKKRLSGNRYCFGKHNEYEIIVARNLADRKRAWAMVYRMYREKGYAAEDQDGLWYGMYDVLEKTTTFLVTCKGKDIATLTTVIDSEFGLPSDSLYKDELDIMRQGGRRLCEIISLASEESDSRRGLEILKHMFKVALVMASKLSDATDFVITVNPHHSGYYEKRLLFQRRGEIRSYGKVGGAPATFMSLDLEALPVNYARRYGLAEGSLAHHFTDEKSVSETIMFLSESLHYDGRLDLLQWFRRKKPAVLEKLNRFGSPFDLERAIAGGRTTKAGHCREAAYAC